MSGIKRRLPPLNAMRAFEAAARSKSFTRAADELHVTQAAISHQVKTLEEWLGVPLFQRLNRGLKLTPAGEAYLPRLTQAFDLMTAGTSQLVDRAGKSVIFLSTLDSLASLWLLPRLHRFRQRHPNIDVRVVSINREDDTLTQGDVDIDIRLGDGSWSGLYVVPLLSETISPVCSPDLMKGEHPLYKPEDLAHHTLLHDVMTTNWHTWFEAAEVEGIDAGRGPGFNRSYLVIQAAINGDGVALGRSVLATDAIKAGKLVKPFDINIDLEFSYYFVCGRAQADEPSIRAFREWLLEEAATTHKDVEHYFHTPQELAAKPVTASS